MIHVVIPSKRTKPTPKWLGTSYTTNRMVTSADMATLSAEHYTGEYFVEVLKRNKIIKELLKDWTFFVGDVLTPNDAEELEKQGDRCKIIAVYTNTVELEPDWPKDNKPWTIKFQSEKTGKAFYCNPSYFKECNVEVSSGV